MRAKLWSTRFWPILISPILKLPRVRQDFVEHFRQNQRIDDVAAQFDGLGKHRPKLARRSGAPVGSVITSRTCR